MDTLGGGWTLLLKATRGTTFQYDSAHWTTGSTLNAGDATLADTDAKFPAFNAMECTEIIAIWPEGSFTWRTGTFSPTTPLQFFQTPRVLSTTPLQDHHWQPNYFSYQGGNQLFSPS